MKKGIRSFKLAVVVRQRLFETGVGEVGVLVACARLAGFGLPLSDPLFLHHRGGCSSTGELLRTGRPALDAD